MILVLTTFFKIIFAIVWICIDLCIISVKRILQWTGLIQVTNLFLKSDISALRDGHVQVIFTSISSVVFLDHLSILNIVLRFVFFNCMLSVLLLHFTQYVIFQYMVPHDGGSAFRFDSSCRLALFLSTMLFLLLVILNHILFIVII